MIRGLLRKTLLETGIQLALFSIALMVVACLLTMLLPQVERGINQVMAVLPVVRKFIQALLGDDLGAQINPQTLQSIVWVHPTVLALLWAQEIVFCSRVPAGEIDRGTVDILLSWPVSRRQLFCWESTVWLVSGVLSCGMMLLGTILARQFAPSAYPASWQRVLLVLSNLLSIYVAVGGVALLVSALSNHRGRAMAVVFGLVLASFLLNFLAQFWEPAHRLAALSVLNYYRPAQILAGSTVPTRDIAVLWTLGAGVWVAALEVFARRNIATL